MALNFYCILYFRFHFGYFQSYVLACSVQLKAYKDEFYLCFEHVDLLDSAGVSLANHWDDVDLLVDLLHHLHIQRLEPMTYQPIRD